MRSRNRLGSSSRIRHVYASGSRGLARGVTCTALASDSTDDPKVAVVATRKVGGAVQRNRAKRRLRAAIRPLMPLLRRGSELVLAAGPEAVAMKFQDLESAVRAAVARAGVLADA